MKKKKKSNAKEKIARRKCNINNNEVRYLLKKFRRSKKRNIKGFKRKIKKVVN